MTPVRKQIADILRHVDDPELGINIVDLGLIYGLRFADGDLTVTLTMTTPACPMSSFIKRSIRAVIDQVDGIERVHIDVVWNPSWSPQMIDPQVRREQFQRPTYPSQYT